MQTLIEATEDNGQDKTDCTASGSEMNALLVVLELNKAASMTTLVVPFKRDEAGHHSVSWHQTDMSNYAWHVASGCHYSPHFCNGSVLSLLPLYCHENCGKADGHRSSAGRIWTAAKPQQ